MKNVLLIVLIALTFLSTESLCQKTARDFGEPILTDTLSTVFFPTRYNNDFLAENKIALWRGYYANMLVYDFQTDSYRKLFETDTYIEAFELNRSYRYETRVNEKIKNITAKWVFLLVKDKDYNKSGRVDERDPSILYVATTKGENLRPLTDASENVISFDVFEDQGFGLIKLQKDTNKDQSFKYEDKEFYYRKINLNDLSFGKGIELK